MLQTEVLYESRNEVSRVLGEKGLPVLEHVIGLIQDRASREEWPLSRIIVTRYRDYEDKNWEFVLLKLNFATDFETGYAYLESLYPELDNYAYTLDKKSKELLLHLIHYDIETA